MKDDTRPILDAKTFQRPLAELVEAIAQKVNREGPACLRCPKFVAEDMYLMIRHSLVTYNLLFYLNADERRDNDPFWNDKYGIVAASVVRSMIDCLYNVTAILQNPSENGPAYHKSGLKKRLKDIAEDEEKYGGKPEWDSHNAEQRKALDWLIRYSKFTEREIMGARDWPTLGRYIAGKPDTLPENGLTLNGVSVLPPAVAAGPGYFLLRGQQIALLEPPTPTANQTGTIAFVGYEYKSGIGHRGLYETTNGRIADVVPPSGLGAIGERLFINSRGEVGYLVRSSSDYIREVVSGREIRKLDVTRHDATLFGFNDQNQFLVEKSCRTKFGMDTCLQLDDELLVSAITGLAVLKNPKAYDAARSFTASDQSIVFSSAALNNKGQVVFGANRQDHRFIARISIGDMGAQK